MMIRAMRCPPVPGCWERGLIGSGFMEDSSGDKKGLTGLEKRDREGSQEDSPMEAERTTPGVGGEGRTLRRPAMTQRDGRWGAV